MRILVAGATEEIGHPRAALRPAVRYAAGWVSHSTAATERGRTLGTDPVAYDVFDFGALGEHNAEHRRRLALLRWQAGHPVNQDVHGWASANAAPGLPDPNKPARKVVHRGQRWMRENLPLAAAEPPEPAPLSADPLPMAGSAHSRAPTDGDPGASRDALRAGAGLIYPRMLPQPSGPR